MGPKSRIMTLILFLVGGVSVSHSQNLVCSDGYFDQPMFCTVNDVPLVCKSAVGNWNDGNLTYPGWYNYTVSTQDSTGNLAGNYDDGYYHLSLSGHFDV